MNRRCGIAPFGWRSTSLSNTLWIPPMNCPPGQKASEYPPIAQRMPTTPSAAKLIIMVLSAFFERTRPP
jgi:hypothetical protein